MFLSSMPTESYSFKYSSQLSLFLDLAERIPQNKYSSQVTANQIWCPVTCRLFTKVNITVLGCVCCAVRSRFSHVQLFATIWTEKPAGLQSARLLCPWVSPGKNTGVGCHAFLQGIFPTQGSNLHLLWLFALQADSLLLSHQGSPLS